MIGGNASAEGADGDAGGEDSSETGCNIVLANRLKETSFGKKDYKKYIGDYMKT